MNKVNERKIAVSILADIKSGVPSQAALANMATYTGELSEPLDKRSRGFITQLVYGTLENYMYIDYIIVKFTGKSVSRLKKFIADVLELSIYQLLFLKNIPEHAVVNEAVSLVQASPQRGLKGFVNAVLRNIARSLDSLPTVSGDEMRRLSVMYSVPEFVADVISRTVEHDMSLRTNVRNPITESDAMHSDGNSVKNSCFKATEAVLRGLRERRPVVIRCNTRLTTPDKLKKRLEEEGVRVELFDGSGVQGLNHVSFDKLRVHEGAHSVHDDALRIHDEMRVLSLSKHRELDYVFYISDFDSIDGLKAFREGLFYVQDIGSILSGAVSGFEQGERVLDLCAAPGGKSIGAALAGAVVDSRDISKAKTDLIRENAARLCLDNISISEGDASIFDKELEGKYDCVIADVPCSGIGIIGRKPDIALHLKPERIESLLPLQRKILSNAARYVKRGGRLVYSTCTINVRENAQNTEIINASEFETLFEKQWLPGIDGDIDGFYTKVLVRL